MLTVYIYCLIDPRTDEVRYVGLTRFLWKRFRNHIHKGPTKHFCNWISSLKRDSQVPSLRVLEIVPEERCGEAERSWIAHYRSAGSSLLNYTDGGESQFRVSAETREKNSARQRGVKRGPLPLEVRKKLSLSHKGRLFNPNAAKIISELNVSRTGVPLTQEHKKKVSESVKRSMTPEVRAKMSASHKGCPPHLLTERARKNFGLSRRLGALLRHALTDARQFKCVRKI